jgi:hypothetical protein
MRSGQFYRGKIDGVQKNFESPNLDKLLPADKLGELADYYEEGVYSRFFKKERVITRTVISPAENSDGRRGGVTNHTVLYQFDRTTTHDGLQYIFDTDEFIFELQMGNHKLKMPQPPTLPTTESDFALIDAPPPLEWEV